MRSGNNRKKLKIKGSRIEEYLRILTTCPKSNEEFGRVPGTDPDTVALADAVYISKDAS